MTKEELARLGLDEETAGRIAEALKDYVPQARLDEAVRDRDAARSALVERDAQLEALKAAGDAEELSRRIEALQEENRQKDAAHAEEVRRLRVDGAVTAALTQAGARNLKAARALLDLERAELTEDGRVKGLDRQIEALRAAEDSKFLFAPQGAPAFRGAKLGEQGVEDGDAPAGLEGMSYDQLCAYLDAHPGAELN